MGKKQEVLLELFHLCQQRGQYVFDNDMVEAVCRRIGFKNKFDATKLDNISLLPAELRALDYAVIHKGRGQHEFVRGIEKIYHRFEPISKQIEWPYRKSLLNEYNSSAKTEPGFWEKIREIVAVYVARRKENDCSILSLWAYNFSDPLDITTIKLLNLAFIVWQDNMIEDDLNKVFNEDVLARESMRVLKPDGNLFFINYPKQNAYLRVKYLDDAAFDVHEYVWVYNTNVGHSPRHFTTAHRSILHATKSKNNKFYKENVAQPYQNPTDKRIRQRLAEGHKGRMPYSWLYFDLVKNVSKDKTFHACQIPLGLVETLIKASTQEGDTVLILFGGSGSEIVLTQQLKRNFVSCEIHREYYAMIVDRLQHAGMIRNEYRLNTRLKN